MSSLEQRLLAAHGHGDLAALVALYSEAAAAATDANARGFFLTHAHVFALDLGHPDTATLRAQLIEMGREDPL